MNDLFRPYLRKFVLVFFDDILVFSNHLDQHMQHLELVFQKLQDENFFLKQSKYEFGQQKIEFLGHIVSERGVEPEPTKIQAMQ